MEKTLDLKDASYAEVLTKAVELFSIDNAVKRKKHGVSGTFGDYMVAYCFLSPKLTSQQDRMQTPAKIIPYLKKYFPVMKIAPNDPFPTNIARHDLNLIKAIIEFRFDFPYATEDWKIEVIDVPAYVIKFYDIGEGRLVEDVIPGVYITPESRV